MVDVKTMKSKHPSDVSYKNAVWNYNLQRNNSISKLSLKHSFEKEVAQKYTVADFLRRNQF
jgi:hypothetical protein